MSFTPEDVLKSIMHKAISHKLAIEAFAEGCPVCEKPVTPVEHGYDDLGHLTWYVTCCGMQHTFIDKGLNIHGDEL